jgi:hydrogenase small subunit
VSLLNSVTPTIDDVLLNTIDLQYHPTLITAAGALAVTTATTQARESGFTLLVVEGAIPTAHDRYCTVWETVDGHHVTMLEAVQSFAARADYVMAVGSCSAFGDIPARSTETGASSVAEVMPGRTVINVSGCPAHPDWIIGAIAAVLTGGVPQLDAYNRPLAYFGQNVHREASLWDLRRRCNCPRSWPRRSGTVTKRFSPAAQ